MVLSCVWKALNLLSFSLKVPFRKLNIFGFRNLGKCVLRKSESAGDVQTKVMKLLDDRDDFSADCKPPCR